MSALIFVLQRDAVHVAMDSLAVDPQDKQPLQFVTKLFPLPHLMSVMCGTGTMPLILDWFVFIQRQIIGEDVGILDETAPRYLPAVAAAHGLSDDLTATVYHFGYLKRAARFVGFAYRSTNGFKSEPLPDGLGMKPPHDDLMHLGAEKIYELSVPGVFNLLMGHQKSRDDQKPPTERSGIGGEVHWLTLQQQGYLLHTCHRFPDYAQALHEMLRCAAAHNATHGGDGP